MEAGRGGVVEGVGAGVDAEGRGRCWRQGRAAARGDTGRGGLIFTPLSGHCWLGGVGGWRGSQKSDFLARSTYDSTTLTKHNVIPVVFYRRLKEVLIREIMEIDE